MLDDQKCLKVGDKVLVSAIKDYIGNYYWTNDKDSINYLKFKSTILLVHTWSDGLVDYTVETESGSIRVESSRVELDIQYYRDIRLNKILK